MMDNKKYYEGNNVLKYYKISQCKETNNVVIPKIAKEEIKEQSGLVCQINESKNSVFLNFYEEPIPFVSDRLKNTIITHQPDAIRMPLALANMNTQFNLLYWILKLCNVNCAVVNSKILLDPIEVNGRKIFKVKTGLREYVIVDFDLAEAMLRDFNVDIEFDEVLVNECFTSPT